MGGKMKGHVVVLGEILKGFRPGKGRVCLRNCFTALLIGMGLRFAVAEAQMPIRPEKIGILYLLQGDSLTELPRVSGKKKTGLLITARSKVRMELQGKTSDVLIEGNAKPTFAVTLPNGDTSKLLLFVLKAKGKTREAVVGGGGGLAGESTAGAETIPLDFEKESADTYRITPAAALNPGEYAFALAGSNEFSCFTVRQRTGHPLLRYGWQVCLGLRGPGGAVHASADRANELRHRGTEGALALRGQRARHRRCLGR
jgi:hypothetical protein